MITFTKSEYIPQNGSRKDKDGNVYSTPVKGGHGLRENIERNDEENPEKVTHWSYDFCCVASPSQVLVFNVQLDRDGFFKSQKSTCTDVEQIDSVKFNVLNAIKKLQNAITRYAKANLVHSESGILGLPKFEASFTDFSEFYSLTSKNLGDPVVDTHATKKLVDLSEYGTVAERRAERELMLSIAEQKHKEYVGKANLVLSEKDLKVFEKKEEKEVKEIQEAIQEN